MNSKKNIRFLVMDVDGTLTDGKIYIGENNEVFKVFDVKDGCGIKDILPQYDILPIVITARESQILVNRCKELNITELHQGVRQKYEKLNEIIAQYQKCDTTCVDLSNVAYIGDDVPDLQCMVPIKQAGGIVGCPGNAIDSILQLASYVCKRGGGDGAVREFIEWLTAD